MEFISEGILESTPPPGPCGTEKSVVLRGLRECGREQIYPLTNGWFYRPIIQGGRALYASINHIKNGIKRFLYIPDNFLNKILVLRVFSKIYKPKSSFLNIKIKSFRNYLHAPFFTKFLGDFLLHIMGFPGGSRYLKTK